MKPASTQLRIGTALIVIGVLLWAYSFKLGFLLLALGSALRTSMSRARVWLLAVAGIVYVGFAYAPLPPAPSILFGLAGAVMTVLMVLVVLA